ncbi:MAG TPA: kelch repeat-containing protein, partial [bacterium]|nr:kelch repeat-containing protein [bacterium]
ITWQVISGGTTLAEEASLDISRSGGRTWNPLPVAAPGATGEAVWTVEGPGSDKCVIALRSPLACEHRFQTSALTPIFSIADAQPYGWVRLDAPAPLSVGSRADAPAAYDAAGDELAVFGGRDTTSHNDLLAFGFTDMTWHVLDDGSSAPPARSSHVMVCDSRDNRLVLYGGIGETGLSDTWQFSFESRSWSEITTLGAEVRIGATAIYDPAGDRLVVFGGSDGQALRNDVRALALRGGQTAQGERGPEPWALINSGSGVTPQPRAYAVGGYDAARRRFIIQGGVGGPSGDSALADTWACSLETGQWELLDNGSSECPGGRWQHAGAVDSDRGRLVVFGGRNGAAEYGDVWIFDLDQATWAQVNGGFDQASPPSPAGAAAVFRPGGDQLVVTGGKSDQLSSSGVWSMDLDTTPPGAKQKSKGPDDVVVAAPEVWPNPARDRFAIAVALREPGPITVGIYDVAGRLVRLLGTSVMPAGRCVFYWDCRDARGMRAASGVYFCRIATPSYVRREPLVVTR